MSNLFEKQQKPFAIKLSERVKEEIKKEFGFDYTKYNVKYFIYRNNDTWGSFLNLPPDVTLITEAEFFGDGNNKLREKLMPYASGYIGSSMLTNTEYPEQIDKNTDELEQINDDFAVKFAEWVIEPKDKPKGEFTITELLQIFKTQYYE